jgi:hypothetical protein
MKVNNPNRLYYLRDNSFTKCLSDVNEKRQDLAGMPYLGMSPLPVRIISSPYIESIDRDNDLFMEREFINVLYEGKKYRVLNYLRPV